MARSHARISRPLLVGVGFTIVIGVLFSIHRLRRAPAEPSLHPAIAALQPSPATQPASPFMLAASVLMTTTPDPASTTRPAVAVAEASGPSDREKPPAPATLPATPSAMLAAQHLSASSETSAAPEPAARPTATLVSAQPLGDARTKKEAGDLIAARAILNDALLSGHLAADDAEAARQQMTELNKVLVFSAKRFPNDPFTGPYPVQSGERLGSIAARHGVTWELLSRVNAIDPKRLRSGSIIKVLNGPMHAVVNKSKFRMDLYFGSPGEAGSMYVTSFSVGLGKDDSTPTGVWMVEPGNKIKHPRYYSPRGEGVIDADDPKNPLGGFWIGISGLDGQAVGKTSYGIHGTIDPSSIGKQASMGCIRLRAEDIALVYEMLIEGKSKVVIKD